MRPSGFLEKYAFVILLLVFASAMNVLFPALNSGVDRVDSSSGSLLNQVSWIIMLLLSMHLCTRNFSKVILLMKSTTSLMVLLLLIILSITWSDHTFISFRRVILALIVVFTLLVAVASVRDVKQVMLAIYMVAFVALLLNFLTLVTSIGIGSDGLFKGIHGHKNTAGMVAAFSIIIGIGIRFSLKMKVSKWKNLLFIMAWALILQLSFSKTSIILLLFSYLIVFILMKIYRFLKIDFSVCLFMMFLALFVFFQMYALFLGLDWGELITLIFGDSATLTGRDYIWGFILDKFSDRPLLGYGYGAFWNVGVDSYDVDIERRFLAMLNQAHNGYLDVLISLGWIGFIAFVWFVLANLKLISSLVKIGNDFRSIALILLLFILMHNLTESSSIRGSHLLWEVHLIMFLISSRLILEAKGKWLK